MKNILEETGGTVHLVCPGGAPELLACLSILEADGWLISKGRRIPRVSLTVMLRRGHAMDDLVLTVVPGRRRYHLTKLRAEEYESRGGFVSAEHWMTQIAHPNDF